MNGFLGAFFYFAYRISFCGRLTSFIWIPDHEYEGIHNLYLSIIMKNILILIVLAGMVLSCNGKVEQKKLQTKRPNILFIAVDDLRPELGCYGSPIAKTPNFDKLADSGLLFERAYCNQAICCPSRTSLMTGARPETVGVIENSTYFRDVSPDIITMPQQFRANGYETVYTGKIFHGHFTDDSISWSRRPAKINVPKPNYPGGYALPKNQQIFKDNRAAMIKKYGEKAKYGLGLGPAYEFADVPDNAYLDGYDTDVAIATMKDMLKKNPDKPFFLGLGFHKPHLNWVAPKKYWDMYDESKIPLAAQDIPPINGAAMGLHASFELRVRYGIPKFGPIDTVMARQLKHAYLGCVSYIDAQLGRMLKAVKEAGIADNTIIILWGDHGWHLGDMGVWGKATDYEIATRVPLMISTPGMPASTRGAHTKALVELVDMYPTLCDLAGIAKPAHLEGQSFVPMLSNPARTWKSAVFEVFPTPALREWAANPLSPEMRQTYFGPLIRQVEAKIKDQMKDKWDRDLFENYLMGYAMRTDRYRMIVWKDRRDKSSAPLFIELYDHQEDPAESRNVADQNPEIVKKLLTQFDKGWQGNLAQVD